jgi:hypothetical protein
MKNNFENRIKFLIAYNPKKSLVEQTGPGITSYSSLNVPDEDAVSEIEYPDNCRYPNKTIPQPKQPDGSIGIEGFCYYRQPYHQKDGSNGVAGIYLPEKLKIEFWDIKSISDSVDKFYLNKNLSKLGVKKDIFVRQMSNVLIPGTVKSFEINEEKYESWISYSKVDISKGKFNTIFFKGYFNKNKQPYVNPSWKDERNKYQKFVDEWGSILQWTGLIATAISGLFCEGCTLPLVWELALELGIGLSVGIRDIQKGENIAGVFSMITGVLPGLKYLKSFRGIDEKYFISLSKKFAESGLNNGSKVDDYIVFYNGLVKEEKRILDKMFRSGDDYAKKEMLELSPTIFKRELGREMSKGLTEMWKQNPELFTKIPFFNRLWVRELSTNASVGVAQLIVEWKYGGQLDTNKKDEKTKEEKDKLDNLYLVIPDNLKKEMTINLLANPENYDEIINNVKSSTEIKEKVVNIKSDVSSDLSDFYRKRKIIKDSVEAANGKYIKLEDNQ